MTARVLKRCAACGELLPAGSHGGRMFCQEVCAHRKRPAPAIYQFVCPDGRCYVGHTGNHRKRNRHGLSRSNPLIDAVIAAHPLETWAFEVLEELPPGCSKEMLRHAEQRHIEKLRSWMPEHGFNIFPAVWRGDTPGISGARARRIEQVQQDHLRRSIERRLKKIASRSTPAVKATKSDNPAVRRPAQITARTREDAE